MRIKKNKPKLAQSVVEPKPPASEIQAIKVAEETGRPLTDTEVAALAAGVLEPNQLAGISVPEDSEDVAMSEDSKDEAEAEQSDREPDDEESDSDDSESESDSDNEERKENADGGGDPVKLEPEEAPAVEAPSSGSAVPMDQDATGNEEEAQRLSSANGDGDAMAVEEVADGSGGKDDAEAAATGMATEVVGEGAGAASGGAGAAGGGAGASAIPAEEGTGGASDDDGDYCSSGSSDGVMPLSVRTKRRKKVPMFPSTGPMAMPPLGDISDGEEEEGLDAGIPMTKNEAEEPILPLGEVTVDEAELVEVGTIFSLVDSDGTIVVRGTRQKMPLDEGSVLSSCPKGSKNSAATEPMGRVHEIFGPVDMPHYTVRVEGAASRHILLLRYQTASTKLMKMAKARAREAMAKATALSAEEEKKSNGDSVLSAEEEKKSSGDLVLSAEDKKKLKAAIQEQFDASLWDVDSDEDEAESSALSTGKGKADGKRTPTNAELREMQRVACMTFGGQKILDLQKAVKDAEEAMGDRKEHPFSRWQVGAKVYALKNHAKYLTADKLAKTSGTDASNCHDEEADEEEFSDDEKERLAKIRERKSRKRNNMLLQGVTPEEIQAIENEEAEQQRIIRERRQAEKAAAGRGGRGGGRGGRRGRTDGRGGRGGGRGDRRGESRNREGGGVYEESAWGGGGGRGTTRWRYDQGSPVASGGVGGMHPPPQQHNQPRYPQQYQGAPMVHMGARGPANGFVPRAMPLGPPGGSNGPPPQVAMQSPGGFQPAFGSPVIQPQQQQPRPQFVSVHGMVPNPSQFVQQQQQQHFQQQQQHPQAQFPPHPGGGPRPFVNHAGTFPPHGPNSSYHQ